MAEAFQVTSMSNEEKEVVNSIDKGAVSNLTSTTRPSIFKLARDKRINQLCLPIWTTWNEAQSQSLLYIPRNNDTHGVDAARLMQLHAPNTLCTKVSGMDVSFPHISHSLTQPLLGGHHVLILLAIT